jgi:hypothetical protein
MRVGKIFESLELCILPRMLALDGYMHTNRGSQGLSPSAAATSKRINGLRVLPTVVGADD